MNEGSKFAYVSQFGLYVVKNQLLTKNPLQNDSLFEDTGNYVWIFNKNHDETWKWARVISNSTKQTPNT